MSWPILLAISIVSLSLAFLVQRVLLKKVESDPVVFAIFEPLIAGAIVGAFTLIRGFSFANFSDLLPNFGLMIVLYALGSVFYYTGVKLIEASEFTILFSSRTIFTIVGAILILNERLESLQVLGAGLILFSVVLITLEKKRQKLKFRRGEVFCLGSSALFGLGFVNDAYILQRFDATLYLTLALIAPALFVWVFNPKAALKYKLIFGVKNFPGVFLLAALYSVSGISFYFAYQVGRNAAQLSALDQLATVLAVFLAIIFLKERDYVVRKIIGALVSFIGVWLLR